MVAHVEVVVEAVEEVEDLEVVEEEEVEDLVVHILKTNVTSVEPEAILHVTAECTAVGVVEGVGVAEETTGMEYI